jgi:hypothetical protein
MTTQTTKSEVSWQTRKWTFEDMMTIGVKKYGEIFYVTEEAVFHKLLGHDVIGKPPIVRNGNGFFLFDRVDMTVWKYCQNHDTALNECLVGNENERFVCERRNFYCDNFVYAPYPRGPEIPLNEPHVDSNFFKKPARSRL